MSALAEARARFDRVRHAMEGAALALMAGDLATVEQRCRVALDDLQDAWPTFAVDEKAISEVLATLAMANVWCSRRHKRLPEDLKVLLERAASVRLQWLDGE